MANPLLSSYRAGENRVTSSTLAVFERIDLALVQELLAAASGSGAELRTVAFENQPATPDRSVPDARITGRFSWWFETKTERGRYANEGHDRDQLRQHSHRLGEDPDATLFVLTPDPVRPKWFDQLDTVAEAARDRIVWIGFRDLADVITNVVANPARLLGEQARFLLTELVALYEADGLLSNDDTVIVAARVAWPEYQRTGAYVCQPDRTFRDGLTHFGFYADGAIQPLIPRISSHVTAVPFSREEANRRRRLGENALGDLIDELLDDESRVEGDLYDIVLLTAPADPETVRLPGAIGNDTVTASGRPWAWTLGQRYTRAGTPCEWSDSVQRALA